MNNYHCLAAKTSFRKMGSFEFGNSVLPMSVPFPSNHFYGADLKDMIFDIFGFIHFVTFRFTVRDT